MSDPVRKNLDCEALCVADRFVAALTVTHDARKLKNVRDPAAVFLPVHLNC